MFALEGASIGFQLGGQSTDYVLLVMNEGGANSVLSSKVKIGADASAAAGPKGRAAGASTDIVMRAEMLTYSSSLPVDENRTITRWSLTVTNAIVDMAGDQHINGIIAGLQQDLPIWRNKVHKHKPVFCKADTSLVQFRKWARQFYVA